jgi:hypothetical protein
MSKNLIAVYLVVTRTMDTLQVTCKMRALIKLSVLTYMFIPTCMKNTGSGKEPVFASVIQAKILFVQVLGLFMCLERKYRLMDRMSPEIYIHIKKIVLLS